MVNQSPEFLAKSTSIGFLTKPFKWAFIILLVTAILFFSSVTIQTYFGQDDLLKSELIQTQEIFAQSSTTELPFHIVVIRWIYDGLYLVIFKLSGIDPLLNGQQNDALSSSFAGMLENFATELTILNDTLKIIAIRIGNIMAFIPLLIIMVGSAVFDGFMKRKIRQQNAARESAAIYHRAKFWRSGIIWTTVFIYLSMPFAIDPIIVLLPVVLLCITGFFQAKYLKKYL